MKQASSPSHAARVARQADALRRNLARRKQQARDRASGAEAGPVETVADPVAEPVAGHEP